MSAEGQLVIVVGHKEPKSNALCWVRILVASFCFQRVPLFLGSTATLLSFTSLLIQTVSSEAIPLLSDPNNISHNARAVQSSGKDAVVGHQETQILVLAQPQLAGDLGQVPLLLGFPFLSPIKQSGWNRVLMFPMISSGSKIVSLSLGICSLKVSFLFFFLYSKPHFSAP